MGRYLAFLARASGGAATCPAVLRELVEIAFDGRGTASGLEVHDRFFRITRARAGRFTHMANFSREADARAAVGLPATPSAH